MKAVLAFFSLLALGIASYFFVPPIHSQLDNLIYYSVCDQPIKYKIGTVDPRFDLSDKEFAKATDQATQIWSHVYGKPLFLSADDATLTVSLIFDERQSLTNQINKLNSNLLQEKNSLAPQIAQFEARATAFENRLAEFNKQVDYWNRQGGAPKEEYEKLKSEQESLRSEADALNSEAQRLNLTTRHYNQEVSELNHTIGNFNEQLKYKPEEGIYDGNNQTIEIYFNTTRAELMHTLAHEFGHARGLEHLESPQDIMFSRTTEKLTPSANDIAALENVCRKRSRLEEIKLLFGGKSLNRPRS